MLNFYHDATLFTIQFYAAFLLMSVFLLTNKQEIRGLTCFANNAFFQTIIIEGRAFESNIKTESSHRIYLYYFMTHIFFFELLNCALKLCCTHIHSSPTI